MKLVVGLGNPGKEYATHRHNVGWMVLDSAWWDSSWDEQKFSGLLLRREGNLFLKPTTFMNSSGDSVATCAGFFKIEPKDIIVIHDEMDIPLGDVRTKLGGGHGGHRGVKSVIERLGTPDFYRIRCGIGRPREGVEVLDHVLSGFLPEEAQALQEMLPRAVLGCTRLFEKDDSGSSGEEPAPKR